MFDRTLQTTALARRTPGLAILALVLFLAGFAAPASAGIFGYAGWETETEDVFAGAGYQLPLGPITAAPSFEWLFIDEATVYTINLDAHLNLIPLGVATLWAGAGMAIRTADVDNFDSDTSTGANLLLGANFNLTSLKPFAQIRQVFIEGDDPFSVAVGIRF